MSNQSQKSDAVKIALIGAAATIAAAVVAGLFGLLQSRPAAPAPAASVAQLPQLTAMATPAPAVGLMFTSKIAPDGEALDLGTTFPATITDLYVAFPANAMPPGLAPFAQRVKDNAHYVHFKGTGTPALSSFGWRWYKDGQQIVEYFPDPQRPPFRLHRFAPDGRGVFAEWGPGTYHIVILMDGKPAMSSDLTIVAD